MILGWQIWKTTHIIEAEAHAVWQDSQGIIHHYQLMYKKNRGSKALADGQQAQLIRLEQPELSNVLACVFLLFFSANSSLQAQERKILFLGIYEISESRQGYWCRDHSYEHREVESEEAWQQARREFLAAHKGESPYAVMVRPGQVITIYQYEYDLKGFDCRRKGIGYRIGQSLPELSMSLREPQQRYKDSYRPLVTWGTGLVAETEDYNGVFIIYMAGKSASGKWVLIMRAYNTHKDKKAVIHRRNGTTGSDVFDEIQPNGILTRTIENTDEVDVYVNFIGATEKAGFDVIQTMKNWVGSKVRMSGDQIQKSMKEIRMTCMCVRG